MARTKKKEKPAEPIYFTAGLADNLIRISWKTNISFDQLRKLNPDIKGPGYILKMGQRVRLS